MKRVFGISLILLSFIAFAAAQTSVVPIVSLLSRESDDGFTVDYGSLLGGVENGKWLDAKTTFGRLKGTEKYLLFDFEKGTKSENLLGKIEKGPDACPENYYFGPEVKGKADFAVGANANWQIFPRRPKAVSVKDGTYLRAVGSYLNLKRMTKIPSKIKQAVSVDLDGDGREEIILAAHQFIGDETEGAKRGSYSFLIIQKTTGGRPQTLFVGGTFLNKAGDYFEGEYMLSGIADLNGDGKMELIVDVSGYEENWTKIYEMKAGKPVEIKALSYYCGA